MLSNLESFVRSPDGQKLVQEQIVTEREGRYVIPVKIEAKHEIKGIVHDVSNTGATIFVEPWETVEEGNELRGFVNEERREVERILTSLSVEVGLHEKEISRDMTLAAELDFIFAKAKYARRAKPLSPKWCLLRKNEDRSCICWRRAIRCWANGRCPWILSSGRITRFW